MPFRDTLDKVIPTYFACMTREQFEYKGATYYPRVLRVSPDIVRGFTCPPKCGACCPRFSLDYLEPQTLPGLLLTKRWVEVNGWQYPVWSDMQSDHDNHHCKHVSSKTGRCDVHGTQPFSCDFELMRFMQSSDGERAGLTTKLYGRAWAMLRVDGTTRGTKCEILPPSEDSISDTLRKLRLLQTWMEHFGLTNTYVPSVVMWVKAAQYKHGPLVLEP